MRRFPCKTVLQHRCSPTVPLWCIFPCTVCGEQKCLFLCCAATAQGTPVARPKTAATPTSRGFFGQPWVHPPVCRDPLFSQAVLWKCAFQWFHTGNKHIRYTWRPTVQFLVRTPLGNKSAYFLPQKALTQGIPSQKSRKKIFKILVQTPCKCSYLPRLHTNATLSS